MAILRAIDSNHAALFDEVQSAAATVRAECEALPTGAPEAETRRNTLLTHLNRLQAFANAHYQFFQDGFDAHTNVTLKEDVFENPIEDVLGTIVFQEGVDLELVLRAAVQRQSATQRAVLKRADEMASAALEMFVPLLTDKGDDYTAVTYLNKANEIRNSPYSTVAFIGLPMSVQFRARDFLASAHEVGHFVFHHRTIDPTTDPVNRNYVRDRFSRAPRNGPVTPFADWQEEIFADVCGALIAGPIMAYDFQALMSVFERRAFIDRDDTHPAPFLRPLIYSSAVREAAPTFPFVAGTTAAQKQAWSEAASLLDERWFQYLRQRWDDTVENRQGQILDNTTGDLHDEWRDLFDAMTNAASGEEWVAGLIEMSQRDTEPLSWDSDNYLREFYYALGALTVETGNVLLHPDVEAIVDRALEILDQGVTLKPNGWFDPAQISIVPPTSAEFEAQLATVHAVVPALNPTNAANAAANTWSAWTKREGYFPNPAGGASFGFDDIAKPYVGFEEPAEPAYFEVQQNKPASAVANNKPVLNWKQIWFAGGWATGPARGSPPSG